MKDNQKADELRVEGNELYKQKKFIKALAFYNKSLCFATLRSVQIACAFANRSAIYLEINRFDKCLENIQLAKDNNHPDVARLEARKKKCVEMMGACATDPENDPESFIKLSYPANEMIPFIVNCLKMEQNEKFGRHIVTTQDLSPGDIIAIEEPIMKFVKDLESRYLKCLNCLKSNSMSLIPCNTCSNAMFCSKACSLEAQEKFHFIECKLITSEADYVLKAVHKHIRIVLESLSILKSFDKLESLTQKSIPTTVFDFDCSNRTDQETLLILHGLNSEPVNDPYYKVMIPVMTSWAIRLFKEANLFGYTDSNEKILKKILFQHPHLRNRNEIGLSCENGTSGILAFGSLINHSCDPNLGFFYSDNKIVFIVVKPIVKGEQLFIRYTSTFLNMNRQDRQKILSTSYSFHCSCDACLNDYDMNKLSFSDKTFVAAFKGIEKVKNWFTSEPFPSFKEVVEVIKWNNKYIKHNFINYPTLEIWYLVGENMELFGLLSRLTEL